MTNAIFTLLYNTNYLAGALVLGTTLKKLLSPSDRENTKLGILIDKSNFTPYQLQLLSNYYDELIDVSPLKSTIVDKLTYDLKRPELDKTFTKINLWSLIKFEKILYLDSDTLPIIPINEDAGSILNLLALDFPKFKILAAPDSGFPDIFNSGVFVLRPNLDDFTKLSALVKESATNPDVSFDGADQGLLNQYFNAQPDWVQNLLKKSGSTGTTDLSDVNYTQESNWIKIPFLYNVTPSAEYQYLPAFKHFQQPPGVLEQPPAEAELEDHGGEQPKHDEEVWKTTVDTLGRYHSTALSYINYRTTQVKLVHFIGPYKPWRSSSNIGGIHKDWWKIWIDEFGEKSVPDVIYREQHPIQETSSEQHDEPHQYEEIISETHEEEEVIEEIPQPPPIDTSDPNSLLDPANYQRFEDNVQPSIDSMWDPTREPPPVHEEYSAPQGYEDFDQSLKSFTNEWDQPDHHHQPPPPPPPPPAPEPYYAPPDYHEEQHPPQYHHEEHHEEPHHEEHHHEEHHHEEQHHEDHHHEEAHFEETLAPSVFFTPSDLYAPMEPKEKPELYGHRYVEPERVFDTDNDYYPNHILQEVEKIDISKESNDESKDLSPNPANLATNVTGFNEANEDFSKGGYIEENPFEEIYDEDQEGIDPEIIEEELLELEEEEEMEIPKLFPWEFREKGKVVTERVFDF